MKTFTLAIRRRKSYCCRTVTEQPATARQANCSFSEGQTLQPTELQPRRTDNIASELRLLAARCACEMAGSAPEELLRETYAALIALAVRLEAPA